MTTDDSLLQRELINKCATGGVGRVENHVVVLVCSRLRAVGERRGNPERGFARYQNCAPYLKEGVMSPRPQRRQAPETLLWRDQFIRL